MYSISEIMLTFLVESVEPQPYLAEMVLVEEVFWMSVGIISWPIIWCGGKGLIAKF